MPYQIAWHQEGRIILGRCFGVMSMEEVIQWGAEMTRHLDEGAVPVHLIIDVSALQKFPTNILQLKKASNYTDHPNLGWLILMGSSTLVNTFATIITQLAHREFRSFKTLDMAVDFLIKQDKTLTVSDS